MRLLILIVAMWLPFGAHAFTIHWPLACTLGEDCFIQNFVDHDTTRAAHDFVCNANTYDGHDGTDIRLRSLTAMHAGVAVKAVAEGVVVGTRTNVEDISIRAANAPSSAGKECGNGVNIQHAEGYRTQYCHMMKGSIRVRTGQQVKAGDVLGNVGLSGGTEFPHLHLGLWRDRTALDPFTGSAMTDACNASLASGPGMWSTRIPYQPSALLNDGIVDAAPDKEAMRDAPQSLNVLPADAPALLYWVDVMNVRTGDELTLTITAPDGRSFAQKTMHIDKPMAMYFSFIGKKNSVGKWPLGAYQAHFALMRDGAVVATGNRSAVVQ
ncbi:MAG: M23 family metallopeptidase [Rickettsiales bacterium]